MGFLIDLWRGRSASREPWKTLPAPLQPLYRALIEGGVGPTATPYLPLSHVVDPLREHGVDYPLAKRMVRATCRRLLRSGYRLAGSTDDARAGFLAPEESHAAVAFAARTLTRCAMETDLAFVAPHALAMYAGSRRSRPSIDLDLEQEGVRALRDLAIAERLIAIGMPTPLQQRLSCVDTVEGAIEAQLIGDLVTYLSLLPDEGLVVHRSGMTFRFFGPSEIVSSALGGMMRARHVHFLPIGLGGEFLVGVDAFGALGRTGTIYAAARGTAGPLAEDVGAFLHGVLTGELQRRLVKALESLVAARRMPS